MLVPSPQKPAPPAVDHRETSPPDHLRERLERAASGLVYSSEGDHPFEFFAVHAPPSIDSSPAALAAVLLPE